jgi:hypothetical protein
MEYRYLRKKGALQEAGHPTDAEEEEAYQTLAMSEPSAPVAGALAGAREAAARWPTAPFKDAVREGEQAARMTGQRLLQFSGRDSAIDRTHHKGPRAMFFYIVPEGEQVLVRHPDGRVEIVVGPRRIWKGRRTFVPMEHYVAHPGEFLIVRFRDGRQEHLPGPAHVWFDPRIHLQVSKEDALQIAAKEAVVVYSRAEGHDAVSRRIVHGPAMFVPRPGEWLHTFSWHASRGGSKGVQKIPNGLVFQKLWLMPDQMYHDVIDVRTADDALLTIRLMIFFELRDIETMLNATHDPIGDFVNAATSDVVDFLGRLDFEAFKQHTDKLNDLATYKQLAERAQQCGYLITKVVYRGYGATDALQRMHDQAIESRTRLQLEKATQQQAQELEDYKLDQQLMRSAKQRTEQVVEASHTIELNRRRLDAELSQEQGRREHQRVQTRLDAEQEQTLRRLRDQLQREHLLALKELGVDLTALLTQGRADRVIELRGTGRQVPHLHLDETPGADKNGP